jgi:DNA invertase Pin-like site-specific DNA recombinase
VATIGYVRISICEDQQLSDRQLDAPRAADSERIQRDRGSDAGADPPGCGTCVDYLRKGTVMVVLDRRGRRVGELRIRAAA